MLIQAGSVRKGMWIVGLLVILQGCGPGFFPSADVESEEPNNNFSQAQAVNADALRTVQIAGSFSAQNDLDVFSLGDLVEGETISVQMRSSRIVLGREMALVIFDGDLNAANAAGVSPSLIFEEVLTHVVRKSGHYYLALSSGELFTQTYSVVVALGTETVPPPRPQTVFLNFNGISSLNIGSVRFRNLLPFSSTNLAINHAAIAADILQRVRNDFGNLNISIVSSYDTFAPAQPHSTIYITGSEDGYFGLAESIDWYNENPQDNAVVFAGSLAKSASSTGRFSQLVANVVTHETGHLLGLIHTDDNTEIMDISTPTFMLEMDQAFHRAPLASKEFPIGWEDTLELLTFTLGILHL